MSSMAWRRPPGVAMDSSKAKVVAGHLASAVVHTSVASPHWRTSGRTAVRTAMMKAIMSSNTYRQTMPCRYPRNIIELHTLLLFCFCSRSTKYRVNWRSRMTTINWPFNGYLLRRPTSACTEKNPRTFFAFRLSHRTRLECADSKQMWLQNRQDQSRVKPPSSPEIPLQQ